MKLVVFIFPIDIEKVKRGEIDAGKCEDKIKARGLTPKNADPNYREEARKVWHMQPDGSEMPTLDSIIVVDDELGFKAEDIVDDFSFGNGTTIGGVRLKNEKWIPCGFVVLDHANKAKADGLKGELKKIFKGLS